MKFALAGSGASAAERPRGLDRILVPALVGFGPLLILLLTWNPGGVHGLAARAVREYALPIIAVEQIVVGLAIARGLGRWLGSVRPPRIVLAALLAWAGIAFATALLAAPLSRFSLFLTLLWILHLLFALSVAWLIARRAVDESALAAAILAGFLLYAVPFVLFPLVAEDPANFRWLFDMPGLGHLRRSGVYATAILGLSAGLLAMRDKRLALPLLAAFAGCFLVVWSGARAPLLALAGALLVGWVLFPRLRQWWVPALLVLAAAAAFALASVYPLDMGVHGGADRLVTNATASGRLEIWRLVFENFLDRPWFGHGEGQTAPVIRRNFMANAHNLPLQTLFAWGIVGTFCVAILAFWAAGRLLAIGRRVPAALPWLMGALALLAQSPVDGTLYDVASLSFFALFLGAALGVAMREEHAPAAAATLNESG